MFGFAYRQAIRTAAPSGDVVDLASVKAHLYIEHDDDDSLLTSLISTHTERLDGINGLLGRALLTQTWRFVYDRFAAPLLWELPFSPVQSVVIKYLSNGIETVFSADNYRLLGNAIILNEGKCWPDADTVPQSVYIDAVCGYGGASNVPEDIKLTIRQLVADAYEYRGAAISMRMNIMPMQAQAVIHRYQSTAFIG